MQLFLSKKGAFDKKATDAGASAAAAEKHKDAEEGGPGNMRGMMGRGMGQGGGPPAGMGGMGMGQGGQQKPEETPAAPSGAYVTLNNPALRTTLDRVEAKQPVTRLAPDVDAG